MSLQRQHFLLSYLKTLTVGPAGVWTSWPTSQQTSTLPTELTRRRRCIWKLEFKPCCALFPQKRNFASLSLFTCRCMDECWRCTVTCDGLSSHPARNRNIRLMLWKPWWASKHFCRLYLTSQSVEWLFSGIKLNLLGFSSYVGHTHIDLISLYHSCLLAMTDGRCSVAF